MIWGHNIQATLLILLLGLFSFGVLGTLLYLLNMGIIGAIFPLVSRPGQIAG